MIIFLRLQNFIVMPAFPKPDLNYIVNVPREIKRLNDYKANKPGRFIPLSGSDNLLIATWNLANFGTQERELSHLKVISTMIAWFDVVALQEINDNLVSFRALQKFLPKHFKAIFTDASGNNERMCFVFNSKKIVTLEKVGEIAVAAEDLKNVKMANVAHEFKGFSRSPFLATFRVRDFDFALINVHLYFGDDSELSSMERRTLEAFAVARWADLRRESKYAFTKNIIALGDFNLPKMEKGDVIYDALLSRGFELPEHTSKIYSNIADDMHYDQITFLPGIKSKVRNNGVFDFDGALFSELYDADKPLVLRNYLRYYISDHRIKWMELVV